MDHPSVHIHHVIHRETGAAVTTVWESLPDAQPHCKVLLELPCYVWCGCPLDKEQESLVHCREQPAAQPVPIWEAVDSLTIKRI